MIDVENIAMATFGAPSASSQPLRAFPSRNALRLARYHQPPGESIASRPLTGRFITSFAISRRHFLRNAEYGQHARLLYAESPHWRRGFYAPSSGRHVTQNDCCQRRRGRDECHPSKLPALAAAFFGDGRWRYTDWSAGRHGSSIRRCYALLRFSVCRLLFKRRLIRGF